MMGVYIVQLPQELVYLAGGIALSKDDNHHRVSSLDYNPDSSCLASYTYLELRLEGQKQPPDHLMPFTQPTDQPTDLLGIVLDGVLDALQLRPVVAVEAQDPEPRTLPVTADEVHVMLGMIHLSAEGSY